MAFAELFEESLYAALFVSWNENAWFNLPYDKL